MWKKSVLLLALLALIAIPLSASAAPVSQNTRTVTITEQQINDALRVTNPRRTTISNVVVDLQEGQATITATITLRNSQPASAAVVVTPKLTTIGSRTLIEWDITSFTINGKSGSGEYTAARNALTSALRQAVSQQQGRQFSAQSVTVTGDAIIAVLIGL